MKTRLVQGLALLLMVGTVYGQNSQATSSGKHSHDQMQMGEMEAQLAQQKTSTAQDQSMPGMHMPENPTPQQPQQPQQKTPSHENMPGMQMPQTPEPQKLKAGSGKRGFTRIPRLDI